MLATIWLLGCLIAPAQPATRPLTEQPASIRSGDWVLTPRLSPGQELVYRGTFHEETVGPGTRFQRDYRVETRFFVLDQSVRGTQLAGMTTVRNKTEQPPRGVIRDPSSASARLERLFLDPQGRISGDPAVSLALPLEGAPSLEVGAFVEFPRGRVTLDQAWEVAERSRPGQAWKLTGFEQVNGQSCLKIVALQQTDDWVQLRADRGAWRRIDTIWLSTRTGITHKVERTIEHRQPAHREVSQRSVLRYDLESSLQYSARLAADRRQEALLGLQYQDTAKPYYAAPGKFEKQIASLQRKVDSHLELNPPTPYREAVLQIKRRLQAAGRGEVVQVVHHEVETPRTSNQATIGEQAPEFVCAEMTASGTTRLSKWKGKGSPVMLVFYHPGSQSAGELLRFAENLQQAYGKAVHVLGMCVSDETATVLKQRTALKISFPILHGGGVRISYSVTGTPKIVVLDGTGVVRGMFDGWGKDTPTEVLTEIRRWAPTK